MIARLALAAALAACAPLPRTMPAPETLAAAESAFAAASVREGMHAAFLAHFAPDGVLARDAWVVAREHLADRPSPPVVLDWRPAYVEVATSGELGLSTGPWKLVPRDRPDAPPAFGQFVSVWRRAPGGPWQVAVDLGIGHPAPALWDAPLVARTTAAAAAPAPMTLEQAETRFLEALRTGGPAAAYGRFASPDLRFYRDGRSPLLSLADAQAANAFDDEPRSARAALIESAGSSDLGYARGGQGKGGATPSGHYLRVWRLEDKGWRIVLDVVQPARPQR